ncbi:MAG TPA: ABC transporter permease [Rhodanobacteraceae bacterium]|nr:ABC transporter permease [Rhodanobacteraceae bacterium]
MLGYYVDLAWRSLKRTPILTALMVLAIGLGIGASMTMITVLHVMSGDPAPGLSSKLFVPMLDPRPVLEPGEKQYGINGTPDGFTWPDALNLLQASRADRQVVMAQGVVSVRPRRADLHPFFVHSEYATSQFFAMFGVPFRAGGGWTAGQDRERARVVVLNSKLDHKLFGNATGIGRTVRLHNTDFRVIGVLDDWNPQPIFYHQARHGVYGERDQVFMPLQTAMELKYPINGHFSCWGDGNDSYESPDCTWAQFWVELDDPVKVLAYQRFLDGYLGAQHAHGRFPRDARPRLFGMMDWLMHEDLIPGNLKMQMWLAIGFLIVCMLSVVALLLAKFLRRSGEISVRRALGARRRDIFTQFGIESAAIGAAGGLLGLAVAELGLWSVRHGPGGYATLATMDLPMVVGTVVLAIVASLLAGLLPAWRACLVQPALQLKVQ